VSDRPPAPQLIPPPTRPLFEATDYFGPWVQLWLNANGKT
jgi:hypothetical protein